MSTQSYTVRPFSRPSRSDLKDVFRAYLSPTTLFNYNLKQGDICWLSVPKGYLVQAVAWPVTEKIQDNIVQLSRPFQSMHGLQLTNKVLIAPKGGAAELASLIELSECTKTFGTDWGSLNQAEYKHWAWYLEYPLSKAEIIAPGLVLEEIDLKGQKRAFRVDKVNGSTSPEKLHRFDKATRVSICPGSESDNEATKNAGQSIFINQDNVGGLSHQLGQINRRLLAYANELTHPSTRRRRGGVLLHGPSGVGKSLILSKIAKGGAWASIHNISSSILNHRSDSVSHMITKVFAEASKLQPSVLILDNLEKWAGRPNRHEIGGEQLNIAATLCDEMDRLCNSRIFVIAATRKLGDVDEDLRRPGRLHSKIEIPVPDANSRTEILKILKGLPRDASDPDLEALAERTHGYVGADLAELYEQAMEYAEDRTVPNLLDLQSLTASINNHTTPIDTTPTISDFLAAQEIIRPSAMSEVFLETPKVRYSDIGGNEDIKRALHQAISWPLTEAAEMARIGIRPKKALLLYGPPGCSKTLIAQAVATELHTNFLAVKGAELMNMWLGESERAIRETFDKARAASPSVLFFDEVDAIAGERLTGPMRGDNVVTTLLNEMDGIEALKGVFVLAATNCPWALDVALLRPGRFNELLYVAAPDLDARVAILNIELGKMDVDEHVDVRDLAGQMEGFSGAEVVSVCQSAGYKVIEEQKSCGKLGVKVSRQRLQDEMAKVKPAITKEMTQRYVDFGERRSG